jgi:hypothetical protein
MRIYFVHGLKDGCWLWSCGGVFEATKAIVFCMKTPRPPLQHTRTARIFGQIIIITALQQCAACRVMAKTLQERVDYAVSQLVERTVPVYPDEEDESAEQRLDDAYHFARELLGS